VMDVWATSSLTPLIAGGWERDEDLFGRVFPMDLRPQAHEIIRTWLFSTIVRAHLELGVLPWHTGVISGWILDPDRRKMSKTVGNVVTPVGLIQQYGADAVRYWAAGGRPGKDVTFDEAQMRIGRRLATKLLNASRFVLGLGAADAPGTGVSEPLDLAMLAALSTVVDAATASFADYDHTGALEATERFFWTFCDDYIELVKERAYASDVDGPPGAAALSARTALATALSVQLRLFAPFAPYVTEEVWSWWRRGSVHRTAWPTPADLPEVDRSFANGDGALLEVLSDALRQVRRAKSDRQLSMKAQIPSAEVRGSAVQLELLSLGERDLRAAGRIGRLDLRPGTDNGLVVTCTF
jgi:valyl-tRNA synthetase